MPDRFCLTPFYLDQPSGGLRDLAGPEWQVNAPTLPAGTDLERITALHRPLATWVHACVTGGDRPVSVAGDCLSSLGVLAGLQAAGVNPTLVWLDAHGDFNTWETTPSGFLGGMPLAMLVGRGEQAIARGVGLTPLPEAQVLLSDGRDLDPGEAMAVAASSITHLPDATDLLDHPLPDGPLYVHFDTDIVDPAEVPAMNYPAPGGPSADTVRRVFRHLAGTGRVVAASLSAWNPDLDEDGHSRDVSMELLRALL